MALSGLGAATIRALTPVMRSLLTDQCVVTRTTGHVPDGAMGHSDPTVTAGTYACYVEVLSKLGGKEDDASDRITVWDRYVISFLAGTVIAPQDVITQVSSGIEYTVVNNIDTQTNSPLITVNAVYASR